MYPEFTQNHFLLAPAARSVFCSAVYSALLFLPPACCLFLMDAHKTAPAAACRPRPAPHCKRFEAHQQLGSRKRLSRRRARRRQGWHRRTSWWQKTTAAAAPLPTSLKYDLLDPVSCIQHPFSGPADGGVAAVELQQGGRFAHAVVRRWPSSAQRPARAWLGRPARASLHLPEDRKHMCTTTGRPLGAERGKAMTCGGRREGRSWDGLWDSIRGPSKAAPLLQALH